ncbi:MAG: hypothetical protein GY758_02320 [Fuerstiella sp.]|nr:hypothetical protein [Fuerstiella sp.]MCP4787781.1 hypothetical protein [Fuerstiella sp.]MCP4858548.1 hypothetical protein [Fuerstiella sp.]
MKPQLGSQDHPPKWLQRLIDDVTSAIIDYDCHAPIGCHVYRNPTTTEWEISAFVSSTEVVGGPMDGTEVNPPVQLDIGSVMDLFDGRPTVHWQSDSVAADDELAQHISFQGTINKRRVWLRMLRGAPDGTSPGRLVHAGSGEIENLW